MTKLKQFWAAKVQWESNHMVEAAYEEVAVTLLRIVHFANSRAMEPTKRIQPNLRLELLAGDIFVRTGQLLQLKDVSVRDGASAGNLDPTFSKAGFTLLVKAVTIRALYTAAINGQMDQVQELVISTIQYDIDIACNTLDHMPIVWNVQETPTKFLANLARIYFSVYSATTSSHVRSNALKNLADVLERLSQLSELTLINIPADKSHDIHLSLITKGSPDLSNTEIRATGSLLAIKFIQQKRRGGLTEVAKQIVEWGYMLKDNSQSDVVST